MNEHTTPIFIIRHKDPHFSGVVYGVDFFKGKGSTCSGMTAVLLLEAGHSIEGEAASKHVLALGALKAAEREAREAGQAGLAAIEAKPVSGWTESRQEFLKEREEAEKKARTASTGGGQRRLVRARALAMMNTGGKR